MVLAYQFAVRVLDIVVAGVGAQPQHRVRGLGVVGVAATDRLGFLLADVQLGGNPADDALFFRMVLAVGQRDLKQHVEQAGA